VNKYLGFGDECAKRLEEDINAPGSVFQRINEMFEYLPLAAIIADKSTQNKVLCVHGGIGSTVNKIEDIEKIQRPISVNLGEISTSEQQLLVDILWSDPMESGEDEGAGTMSSATADVAPNVTRDPMGVNNITKFGAGRLEKFLKANSVSMILRSHQICSEGLDRFAQG
jgi:protein phosphatase